MEYRANSNWPYHISCGGALYRENGKTHEYALLFRGTRFLSQANSWHLPKGTLKSSETLEACAKREIQEESGFEVAIEGYLGTIHTAWHNQELSIFIDKTIHYFLARKMAGSDVFMDEEHDAVQWLNLEGALAKLKHQPKNEGEIIQRAERYLIDILPKKD